MAERVVSPGVFTNEIDQSFLPAAVSQLGAALIGTCNKGPAFVPTVVNNYSDFELQFGGLNPKHFLPYTAKSYLKNSGVATIVRVLGSAGYEATNAIVLSVDAGTGDDTPGIGSITAAEQNISKYYAGQSWAVQTGQKLTLGGQPNAGDTFVLTTSDGRVKTYKFGSGTTGTDEGSNVTTVNIGADANATGAQLVLALAHANGHQYRTTGTNSSGDVTLTHALGGVPTAAVGVNNSTNLSVTAGSNGAGTTGNFVLTDSAGNSVTFTFDSSVAAAGQRTSATAYKVGMASMDGTNTTVAAINTRIRNAVNLAKDNGELGITATDGGGGVVTLTQNTGGIGGHTDITETDSGNAFTHVDFVGGDDKGDTPVAVIFPSASNIGGTSTFLDDQVRILGDDDATSGSVNNFRIKWGAAADYVSASLDPTSDLYIENVIGVGPQVQDATDSSKYPGYVYKSFKNYLSGVSATTAVSASVISTTFGAWSNAKTPYIISQTGSNCDAAGCDETPLFKFETISSGEASNTDVKVVIANIKKSGKVAGSDYGSFDVQVRKFDDTDSRPQILESFSGCDLDVSSPNYFARKIGDMKWKFNTTTEKLELETGDFPVKSKYIRVSDINPVISNGGVSPTLVPWGHKSYQYPFYDNTVTTSVGGGVDFHWQLTQLDNGSFNKKITPGAAFDSGSTSTTGASRDNLNWFAPLPSTKNAFLTSSVADAGATHGGFGSFRLDQVQDQATTGTITLDSNIKTKKFIVGFQDGRDGFEPRYFGGPNGDGTDYGLGNWDGTATYYDSGSYYDAITTISNPDEIDINMIVMPGIDQTNYSKIISRAIQKGEDRADVFIPFDADDKDGTITTSTTAVETFDSNYASTYYPWVKIFDGENNKNVWVPPSVVVPGVIAQSDKLAHEWFAPAGLNRGNVTEATMVKDRLTHKERDTLYTARVNPIAQFPGEGVVVWGQKTLQDNPSALDRVNVRRLLIRLKKFIASSSRYLVFEQNTEALRQKFLNIVNPFLESVQSNSGLTAFRVQMDDSNNPPDVVDRNELRGSIFIQPARTAEFIVLDFVVMPTGASFGE